MRPDAAAFAAVPSESIDYAVMETVPPAGLPMQVVPLDAGWSDLGAWDAVWQVLRQGRRTATPRSATCCSHDSRNTLVMPASRLVAASAWTTWWWSRPPTR